MPNVLSFHMGADPAGISGAIARAFRGDAEWTVHSLVSSTNFIRYPPDLKWTRYQDSQRWRAADVVHLHNGFVSGDRMRRRKPAVVQYHGSLFRRDPAPHLKQLRQRGALGVVSTLDLHVISGLEWLPSPMNVTGLAEMRQVKQPERIVIAHAPTDRGIKSTALFLEAFQRLQDEGYPVDLELIEQRTWAECLQRKARADIFYDQVMLGYGNNALEAWGMGIPVIAGAADPTLDEMERRFGHLPFYHATEETIYDALKELVESPELRAEYGRIGHEYVRKYHDEPVVVEQLKRLYRRAMGESDEEAA